MQKELIGKIAAAIGKTEEETAVLLSSNPRLNALFDTLSPKDAEKLVAVLSDKSAVSRILATPQARQMMDALGGKNGRA